MLEFAFIALVLFQIFIFEFMLFFCKGKPTLFRVALGTLCIAVLTVLYYYLVPDTGRNKSTLVYEELALISPFVIIHTIISGSIFNQTRNSDKRTFAYISSVFVAAAYIPYAFFVACAISGSCI